MERLCLPGHGAQAAPEFDAEACLAAIAAAAAGFRARGRELVLVGHSTGATLALAQARIQRTGGVEELADRMESP